MDDMTIRHGVLLCLFLTLLSPVVAVAEGQPAPDKAPANLLQLYDLALTTNPIVEGRRSSILQAEAQKDQARSKLLPQVSATGNISWNEFTQEVPNRLTGRTTDITTQYQGLRGVVQARQALFDLASYRAFEGAGFIVKQAEQDLEDSRMTLATDLVDRYFEFLEATDEAGYLQSELDLTEGDMQRIRRMYERAMAKVTDLYEVEAYYQTLKTRELELYNAMAVALEKVREVVGVPVTDLARLKKEELPPVPGQADQWVTEAVQRHPAMRALQHALEAAAKTIASQWANHLPQVSLQMSGIYAKNGGFDNRQLDPYTVGTLGLQFNVPLYSGGSTKAGEREAIARFEITKYKRLEKQREIERETRTAYLNAQTGYSRIASTAREVEARVKARDGQLRGYELGASTIVAVLEAKKNLLKSRFGYAKARYDYIRSVVALRVWGGTITRTDLEEINGWLVQNRWMAQQ
ncbi:MAG: TolC family protein [Candidatus Krumholzibacteria bacterium]|nr:TolC family protein [Candidatus Krumholzibacteria bacterium]MDH5271262.1 TolC family protein [Candidatus Krumholzibacteria bacterium]